MKSSKLSMLLLLAAVLATTFSCGKDNVEPVPESPFDRNGASKALFSVAADRQVHISRGNLQYQASTGTWRFAEKQYEVMGWGNQNVSLSNEGWIDCFCWGTSGWESGANAYQPWAVSTDDADYQPGGSWENGLQGNFANADWGVYNAIVNGGNQAEMWRTLKNTEWAYLLGGDNRVDKWGRATIDGRYKGILLLPDEWTPPDGISFTPALVGFSSNVYTLEQWERMEAAGAIFLPAAGYRHGRLYDYKNSHGIYWSVSPYNASYADCAISFLFTENELHGSAAVNRSFALSVRLVQDK